MARDVGSTGAVLIDLASKQTYSFVFIYIKNGQQK